MNEETIERKRFLLDAAEGEVREALGVLGKAIDAGSPTFNRSWPSNVGFRLKQCLWFIDIMKCDVDTEEREVKKPSVPDDIETRMAELDGKMKDVLEAVSRLERDRDILMQEVGRLGDVNSSIHAGPDGSLSVKGEWKE